MLSNTTFIVPLRIESFDRLRNVVVSSIYLLDNTDCTLIIKESDSESAFEASALSQIKECVGEEKCKRLIHVFEKNDDQFFHRTRLLNDMVMMTKTPVVVNYDCDILLPLESYQKCEEMILDGTYDMVYPYGDGNWQYQIFTDDDLVSRFINNDYDLSILLEQSKVYDAKYGFCQFYSTEKYIEGGLENENFIAYGYEDNERYHRFKLLGYNVGRYDGNVYHMEHERTPNSWFTNPYIENNKNLYEMILKFDTQELSDYYDGQEYLKTQKAKVE